MRRMVGVGYPTRTDRDTGQIGRLRFTADQHREQRNRHTSSRRARIPKTKDLAKGRVARFSIISANAPGLQERPAEEAFVEPNVAPASSGRCHGYGSCLLGRSIRHFHPLVRIRFPLIPLFHTFTAAAKNASGWTEAGVIRKDPPA